MPCDKPMPGSLITHPIVPPPHRCPIRVAPQNPCSTHPDLPLSFQVSSEPLVFFALASPPFPASYPHLLIPESWPVGATHMALMPTLTQYPVQLSLHALVSRGVSPGHNHTLEPSDDCNSLRSQPLPTPLPNSRFHEVAWVFCWGYLNRKMTPHICIKPLDS